MITIAKGNWIADLKAWKPGISKTELLFVLSKRGNTGYAC
jgi:hypothetical protein